MNKCFVVLAVALSLTGCAVPADMKNDQQEERQALRNFHLAEREAYRATQAASLVRGVSVAATANKQLADSELKKAADNLANALAE
ncbi:hypothetical protein [Aeromonas aquatica]|uniref:hypothetical protein n=1 Tax=Aeromonas aquatica TaxID=558964 RepID=UPI00051B63CE|nr:hypothetical protein [Aeromonas aquatica]